MASKVTLKKTNAGTKKTTRKEEPKTADATPFIDPTLYGAPEGATVILGANEWEPAKIIIKPTDQLDLKPVELDKEISKILSANNPNAPTEKVARYSFKEKTYKNDPTIEHTAFVFSDDGCVILKESDEARQQHEEMERREEEAKVKAAETATETTEPDESQTKSLKNQFNYSERATQTFNNAKRERGIMTEPPPAITFAATLTQWEIYDAYVNDQESQKQAKEKKPAPAKGEAPESSTPAPVQTEKEIDIIHSPAFLKTVKVMERMVNQNRHDDMLQDYKYWEDQSDNYRDEGSLLPLWLFEYEKVRKKTVTSICWNHKYSDLFAVGYGSYDFLKQTQGAVCCFSLKGNPQHPEYFFTTESGVMSVDFHPQHPSLLAVGCYDGSVLVFDVRQKVNRPIFQSTIKSGKHTDPVWQVRWQEEDIAKNLNFFSVSSDGRVVNWTLNKNELSYTNVMELKLTGHEEIKDPTIAGLAGGTCFDFNKFSDHIFVVGTEEGTVHKCSKAYNSQYLETYEGHYMSVYSVKWNHFHPRLFLSASADWTVKMWDHAEKHPLMSFEINAVVADVAWAPYSSTVFAAGTTESKVHIYDLHLNKHEPMCEQKVFGKGKLTHLCFNPKDPVLLVGNDRGEILALKLSPNLRKAPVRSDDPKVRAQAELDKIEALLATMEKKEGPAAPGASAAATSS